MNLLSILIPAIYPLSIVSGIPNSNVDELFCQSILEYPKGERLSVGPRYWREVVLPTGGVFRGNRGQSPIIFLIPS
jgi:hypothetical protein